MERKITHLHYLLSKCTFPCLKETSNGTGNVAITEISERFALREAQKFPFLKGQVLITVQCFEFFHAQITFMSLKRDFDAIRYYVVAVINYQLDCRDAKRRRPGDENYDSRTLYLPPDFLRSLSYAQKQWWEFKSKHMDKVLFFKMGKFYELFEMDAHVGEKELDLQYMKGYCILVVEQTETPEQKKGSKDKVVRREICSVVTKGTLTDGELLSANPEAAYLMALTEHHENHPTEVSEHIYGVCRVDVATSRVIFGQFKDDLECSALCCILSEIRPVEIVKPAKLLSAETERVLLKHTRNPLLNELVPIVEFWDADKTVDKLKRIYGKTNDVSVNDNELDCLPDVLLELVKTGDDSRSALSALGGALYYLRQAFPDERLLRFAQFKLLPCSGFGDLASKPYLVLDAAALENLEIFENSRNGDSSGLGLQDHYVMWSQLRNTRMLLQGVNLPSALEFLKALSKLPDMERLLACIFSSSEASGRNANRVVLLLMSMLERIHNYWKFQKICQRIFLKIMNCAHPEKAYPKSIVGAPTFATLRTSSLGHEGVLDNPLLTKLGFFRYWSPDIKVFLRELSHAESEKESLLKSTFQRLIGRFCEHHTKWKQLVSTTAELDVLISLAIAGDYYEGPTCRPTFVGTLCTKEAPYLHAKSLGHPVRRSDTLGKGDFVPNDITIGGSDHASFILLTGPKMGGKSTLLRQVCLTVILAQVGATASMLVRCPFEYQFVSLVIWVLVKSSATCNSLVSLGELGRGTLQLLMGKPLRKDSVLEHLVRMVQCRGLFSTHYHRLAVDYLKDPKVLPVFYPAYSALLVLLSLTSCWYAMVMHIEHHVILNSEYVLSQFQSEIEHSAGLIHPINSSSTNFAKLLSSTLQDTNLSFSDIKTKVAPLLFKAFETVPNLAQISYIEKKGLFFSYYTDYGQVLAMYSNSSSLSTSFGGASNLSIYYIQPVNRDTGELYGKAIISEVPSNIINTSWFVKAVNSSLSYASLGTKWNNDHDLLFVSSSRIKGTQVISLGIPVTTITDFFTPVGANLSLVTKDGKMLVEGIQNTRLGFSNDMVYFQSVNANGDQTSYDGVVSCKDGDAEAASILNIQGVEYLIRCSTIDIMEIKSVYVLAVPRKGLDHFVLDIKKKGLALLTTMIVMILIAMVSFLYINVRSLRREMHLCWSLIKQNEATQQAERKCMNKSLAFASASHDVRASLAGLTGLIEMSFHEVSPDSELGTNLRQMDSCTKDLLGLLNSILDASKVEAGKMLLEEEEFDVFQLLEDVVDLYHSVAMKKGVDIVLDPCNGSVLRYSRTKGDRGKLKQVLCNLLSNAVKFTEEGHIAVRAWAQKPSLQSSMIATHQYGSSRLLSRLCCRQNEARDDVEDLNIQQDPNCMDFTIEVDDTGKGIPKEKHKSVFENYVQVKETTLGQEGTGLGLGIVQSLVRLMHGDIEIMDKDIGEKGTCFRFNVLLTAHETQMNDDTRDDQAGSGNKNQSHGLTMSPKLSIWTRSPRSEASRVVLLIQNEERRGTTQRFMERLGIKVKVVKEWRQLHYTLKKIIKQKGLHPNSSSSPESSDSPSASSCTNGVPLSAQDGTNYISSIFKRTDIEASSGFVLIVIDANAGPFSELCKVVAEFKRGLCYPCRVVWLENPLIPSVDNKILNKDVSNSNDIVLSKPLHGHRLFQVIRILPEYGGVWPCSSSETKKEKGQVSLTDEGAIRRVELQECGSSSVTQQSYDRSRARKSHIHQGEIQECEELSNEKPLWGMKCLVVEDVVLLRRITKSTLDRLGASVMECENGEQAVQTVEEGLTRNSSNRPCDFILMDCQMPVMDGYEATRRIREIEKSHGVHIPIFALTANTGKEAILSIEAGMDDHLIKPINKEALLKAIKRIYTKE
ncbi:Histidine kinase CKI1 [Glycine max]|nr:Histidine kinase CKI1 [Glycine max]